MEITCPDCQFTKHVPSDVLEKKAVIANCPKCGCRFRFIVESGQTEKLPPRKVEDDPLPKGAIVIPKQTEAQLLNTDADNVPDTGGEASIADDGQPEDAQVGKKAPHTQEYRTEQSFLREFERQSSANPWDKAPGRIGWIASFCQTCLRIMFSAPRFFASLSPRATFYSPLVFYVIICVTELLVNTVWMTILRGAMADSSDPQLTELLSMLAPQGNILLTIFLQTALSVFKLYVLSALFFCIFQLIIPKKNNFTLIYQVVAYSVAPSLLCIVPIAGSLAGILWSIACLAIGLRTALRVSWMQTVVAFLPIIFLFAASMRYIASIGQM